MNLPPIELDSRFDEAVEAFNRRDYFEASDLFEDLFFEAAGDELEFARVFLQVSVGLVHAERGQRRPAIERLAEALRAIARVTNLRGVDLASLTSDIRRLIASLEVATPVEWPVIRR